MYYIYMYTYVHIYTYIYIHVQIYKYMYEHKHKRKRSSHERHGTTARVKHVPVQACLCLPEAYECVYTKACACPRVFVSIWQAPCSVPLVPAPHRAPRVYIYDACI